MESQTLEAGLTNGTANQQNSTPTFMAVALFKEKLNIATITVVRNPHTGKLFMDTIRGRYKVQQDIALSKPLTVLIPLLEDGTQDLNNACLINSLEANVVGTL